MRLTGDFSKSRRLHLLSCALELLMIKLRPVYSVHIAYHMTLAGLLLIKFI